MSDLGVAFRGVGCWGTLGFGGSYNVITFLMTKEKEVQGDYAGSFYLDTLFFWKQSAVRVGDGSYHFIVGETLKFLA